MLSIDLPPRIQDTIPASSVMPGYVILAGPFVPRKVSEVHTEPESGHLIVRFSDGLDVLRWHPRMLIRVVSKTN